MIADLDFRIVNQTAGSTDSRIYNSAAQSLALEINSLRADRSWMNDDVQVEMIDRMIRKNYDEMIRLLANLTK